MVDRFWRQVDDALGSLGLSSEEQTRLEALVAIRFPRPDRHEVARLRAEAEAHWAKVEALVAMMGAGRRPTTSSTSVSGTAASVEERTVRR